MILLALLITLAVLYGALMFLIAGGWDSYRARQDRRRRAAAWDRLNRFRR